MSKRHHVPAGRESVGRHLQSLAVQLGEIGLSLRGPIAQMGGPKGRAVARLAAAFRMASGDLYEIAVDILLGRVPIDGGPPAAEAHPLFPETSDGPAGDESAAAGDRPASPGRPPGDRAGELARNGDEAEAGEAPDLAPADSPPSEAVRPDADDWRATPLAKLDIDADLGGRVYLAKLRTVGDLARWLAEGHELAAIPGLRDGEAGVIARALLAYRQDRPGAAEGLRLEGLEAAAQAPEPEKPRKRAAKGKAAKIPPGSPAAKMIHALRTDDEALLQEAEAEAVAEAEARSAEAGRSREVREDLVLSPDADDWRSVELGTITGIPTWLADRPWEAAELSTLGDIYNFLSDGDHLEDLKDLDAEARERLRQAILKVRGDRGWGPDDGIPAAWLEPRPAGEENAVDAPMPAEPESEPADEPLDFCQLHGGPPSSATDTALRLAPSDTIPEATRNGLKSEGATDARIREILGTWWGMDGRRNDPKPAAGGCWTRGGARPAFWYGDITPRGHGDHKRPAGVAKPTLQGPALVARVRNLLEIPSPSAAGKGGRRARSA